MASVVEFLHTGGSLRNRVSAAIHGAAWWSRHRRGAYEVKELQLLAPLVRSGSVVLDVGAHAGSWAVPLAGLVGTNGLVVCYEALPHYAKALRACLRGLGVRNVVVRQVAVGSGSGKAMLRWQAADGSLLTGRTHIDPSASREAPGTVSVEVASLDAELVRHALDPATVSFIKIDVEGAELQVLQGATSLLGAMNGPAVFLEAEDQWAQRHGYGLQDIFSEMASHGYVSFTVGRRCLERVDVERYMASPESNVLFVKAAVGDLL